MAFVAITTIISFIHELIASSSKIQLREFAEELQRRFYPDQDISCMDYFFEIAKQENDGKFIVPHTK